MQTKWIVLGVGVTSCALLGGYLVGAANTARANEEHTHVAATVQPCAVMAAAPVASTPATSSATTPRGVEPPALPLRQEVAPRDGSGSEDAMRIRRIVVGTGIEAREPVGVADHFRATEEQLYVFLDITNRHGEEGDVTITFEPEQPSRTAHTTGLVTLHVPAGAARHRTWAWSRNVHAVGRWSAVVSDEAGHELAHTDFVVE